LAAKVLVWVFALAIASTVDPESDEPEVVSAKLDVSWLMRAIITGSIMLCAEPIPMSSLELLDEDESLPNILDVLEEELNIPNIINDMSLLAGKFLRLGLLSKAVMIVSDMSLLDPDVPIRFPIPPRGSEEESPEPNKELELSELSPLSLKSGQLVEDIMELIIKDFRTSLNPDVV
jgi:hypothetical protein